jgi:hypothetical protein
MTIEQVWPLLLIITSAGDDISFLSKPHRGSTGHQCLRDCAPAGFLQPRFCASKI